MAYWWENVQIAALDDKELASHIENMSKGTNTSVQDIKFYTLMLSYNGPFKQFLEKFRERYIPLVVIKQVLDAIDINKSDLFYMVCDIGSYQQENADKYNHIAIKRVKGYGGYSIENRLALYTCTKPQEPVQPKDLEDPDQQSKYKSELEEYNVKKSTYEHFCRSFVDAASFIEWATMYRDWLAENGYKIEDDRSELQAILAGRDIPSSDGEHLRPYGLFEVIEGYWRQGLSVKETAQKLLSPAHNLSHAQVGALLSRDRKSTSKEGRTFKQLGSDLVYKEPDGDSKWDWPQPQPQRQQGQQTEAESEQVPVLSSEQPTQPE